jgi:ABC-type amino acid transport substrate-binding protein
VGLTSVSFPDLASAVVGLQQGQVVAIYGQRYPLLDVLYHQAGFALSDVRYTYRPVAFVLPQGDSAYHDLVNLTLSALQQDGTYGDLYHLWFDDPIPALPVWPGQPSTPLKIIAETP